MNTFPFDPSKQVYEQGISSITYYGQADLGTAVDDSRWSIFSVENTGGDVIQRWACGPNGMPTSSPIFAFSDVQQIDFSLIQIDPNEVGDNEAPTIENVTRIDNTTTVVLFSEPIDPESFIAFSDTDNPNGFNLQAASDGYIFNMRPVTMAVLNGAEITLTHYDMSDKSNQGYRIGYTPGENATLADSAGNQVAEWYGLVSTW